MEEYIVSALKYRPLTFDSVVGQRTLTTTLKNAIQTGKLAHAYLFCGPRGVGKTTCARIFAKTINCLTPDANGDPCGTCESCKAFNEGRSMSIHELDAASNNSVDDIRELCKQVQIPPQIGKYKVFIIDEVHMLSASAFNAFLKTLEEPPSYVIFILATTEKHKILPTILSRCQVYDFARMTMQGIVDHLRYIAQKEGHKAEDEALHLIARKADGGMRDALSIYDQMVACCNGELTAQNVSEALGELSLDRYFEMVEHFLKKEVQPCLILLNDVISEGYEGGNFMNGLASHLRNLLVARDKDTLPLLEATEAIRTRYEEQAAKCNVRMLYKALRICNDCDNAYRTSRNKRLSLEIALIECAQIDPDAPDGGLRPKKIAPFFSQPMVAERKQTPAAASQKEQNTAAPRPAAQQPPQAKPAAPRMKLSALGPSMKISMQTTAAPVQTQTTEEVPQSGDTASVTNEELTRVWFEFIAELGKEDKALAMRMQQMQPQVTGPTSFSVEVPNAQVKTYLQQVSSRLCQFLKRGLLRPSITMEIKVAEVVKMQQSASKKEIYKHYTQENSAMKLLAEEFKLVIE
ncbi:MAG: DNA polymerase III subunit gamma/tau [Bacteroidaceae bacterium]|nr:DNA polymerase III subunit gamma/tau [Bacteroidaceae bacterium]